MAAGADTLPDYELLEMLLFAAYQRGDVKPLAKNLLAKLGGFGEVMTADPDALSQAGLNLAGIAEIKAGREAALRLMRTELQQGPVVNSWDKLIEIAMPKSLTTRSRSSTSCFSTARMYCSSTSASSAARTTIPRSTPARWSSARSSSAPRRDPGAQPSLGRPNPVQSRHRRDPRHQKGRRPARRRVARPRHHRPQPPHQPARSRADLTRRNAQDNVRARLAKVPSVTAGRSRHSCPKR